MSKTTKKRKLKNKPKRAKTTSDKKSSSRPDNGAFQDLAKVRVLIDEMYKLWGSIKSCATTTEKKAFWGGFTPKQIQMINTLDEVIKPSEETVRAVQGQSSRQ